MGCQLFKQQVQNKSILKSPLNLHHFHLTRGSKQLWHQPKRYKNSNTTLIFFGSVVHYPDLPPAKLHAYIFLREIRQYRMKKQVPKYIDVSRLERYSYSQQLCLWHYTLKIFIMAAKNCVETIVIIYQLHKETFLWMENKIWAGFGPIGSTEKKLEADYEEVLGHLEELQLHIHRSFAF